VKRDPLEKQYSALEAGLAAQDATQFDSYLPTGWFISIDAKGVARGLGYFCPNCKVTFIADAPTAVRCCGNIVKQPSGIVGLFKQLMLPRHQVRGIVYA